MSTYHFTQYMSNDPTNALRYVKLKYGIAELEDNAEAIDTRTYFITLLSPETISYVKELGRIVAVTEKEKNLKSSLVILGPREMAYDAISKNILETVILADPKEPKEMALLLYGSLGFVSLLYEQKKESLYIEVMKLGVPLLLPEITHKDSSIGHAAFFLDALTEETVSAALLKLENSTTLRESIVKSALDQIKDVETAS